MIKSVHVVPSIYAEASGVSHCVPKFCDALARLDEELELHVLAPAPELSSCNYQIHAHQAWSYPKRLGVSPVMYKALANAAKTAQIMHTHSVWMLPNIYPASAVKGTQCRLITSPHGCFSEYMCSRSQWLKRVVWNLGQGSALRNTACLHATAEMEHHDIRRKGLRAPVAIIPNGIDVPVEEKHFVRTCEPRRLLFLSRIHPTKGVEILLHAWSKIERQYPDWELYIVGPDEDAYYSQMQALERRLQLERVTFAGPAFGYMKRQAYWSAELFVLPTHTENFGLVVAEALAHGVPVIVTKGAPWSGLVSEKCGWWIDLGVESLAECLREAMSKSNKELFDFGARGRQWMRRDFSWEKIGNMMHETYEWVLGGGSPPTWVITD
jgi:glycosyltransferase involved in cell wall biosynthesis